MNTHTLGILAAMTASLGCVLVNGVGELDMPRCSSDQACASDGGVETTNADTTAATDSSDAIAR